MSRVYVGGQGGKPGHWGRKSCSWRAKQYHCKDILNSSSAAEAEHGAVTTLAGHQPGILWLCVIPVSCTAIPLLQGAGVCRQGMEWSHQVKKCLSPPFPTLHLFVATDEREQLWVWRDNSIKCFPLQRWRLFCLPYLLKWSLVDNSCLKKGSLVFLLVQSQHSSCFLAEGIT